MEQGEGERRLESLSGRGKHAVIGGNIPIQKKLDLTERERVNKRKGEGRDTKMGL